MANNSIIIQPWYAATQYAEYEMTAGINLNSTTYPGPIYWSTIQSNLGHNPSGQFIYAITSFSRAQDLATVNLAFTGACPNLARGSLYSITGLIDPNMNATGMILNAGTGVANQMWIQFINPGPLTGNASPGIGAVNMPEPSWTTGFFWSPSYSSQWEVQQGVINARFDTYEQRQPQGINSNVNIWTMGFNDRTDLEVKGIMAFVQNLAGVYSTPILVPPNLLFNNPNLKYVLANPKVNSKSYNQSDCQVTARQVMEY